MWIADSCPMMSRLQNEELDRQMKALKAELSTMTKLRRPLELEITRLKADVENKVAEIKLVCMAPPVQF